MVYQKVIFKSVLKVSLSQLLTGQLGWLLPLISDTATKTFATGWSYVFDQWWVFRLWC